MPTDAIVEERPWLATSIVDAQFAFEYGEGDRTMKGWRKMFWGYYSNACAPWAAKSRQMPIGM
jgi:uncharacterized protein YhfF